MKYSSPTFRRRNVRAFFASLLSYLLLAAQLTPLALAARNSGSPITRSQKTENAREHKSEAPALNVAPAPSSIFAAPDITATLTDAPNTAVAPGGTITYTATLTNNSATDATGVSFTDLIDIHTTLGTVNSSPLALNDTFNATTNTATNTTPNSYPAPGVRANDFDPDNGTNTGLTVTALLNDSGGVIDSAADPAFTGATLQGGTVTLNPDGSFTYTSANNFQGTDSFKYRLSDGTLTDTAKATIKVDAPPSVTSTTPTNNAQNVSPTSTITINFSEQVNVAAGAFVINCGSTVPFTQSATPTSALTLTPTGGLPPGSNCTVTVDNTLVTDVDANDPPDTLVGSNNFSFKVAPNAIDDNFQTATGKTVIGNISINSGTYSVTGNDVSAQPTQISSFQSLTPNGGTVTLVTDDPGKGQFAYNPPPGFEGTDTFTYTLSRTDGGGSDTATVSITVAGMIWFINNNAASAGDGRLSNPFNTLALFNAINDGVDSGNNRHPAANDNIFIYESATSYLGGITLLNGQKLIGQDATAELNVITGLNPPVGSPAAAPAFPLMNSGNATKTTITNAAGNGIALKNDNIIRGLTVNTTTGAGILGSSITNATVGSDVNVTNATGAALDLNGNGTGIVSFAATVSNTTGRAISVQNRTGGTVTFTGPITDSGGLGSGILLNSNSGATITFSGTLSLSTGANSAFTATGGGTVNVCDKNPCGVGSAVVNTLATTTATALKVTSTNIGTSGLIFRSIASSGGSNTGIILDSTGASGGLTVTGTGAAASGGTIANKSSATDGDPNTGTGIYLNSTRDVSLSWMQINDHQNYGIRGTSVTNFSLIDSKVNGTNGTNVGSPSRESSVSFDGLFGTSFITRGELSGGRQHNLRLTNTNGTLDLTMNGVNIHDTSSIDGDDGINIEAGTSATVDVDIQNCTFSKHGGDHFNFSLLNNATASLIFRGNALSGGHAIGLGQGIFILGATFNGTFKYDISNNGTDAVPFVGNRQGGAIVVNKGSGSGTFSGKIENNVIGNPAVNHSGSLEAFGIIIGSRGTGSHTTLINSNKVRQYHDRGIVLEAGEGSAALDATVTNNTVSDFADAVNSLHGIHSDNGINAADTNPVCIDIKNNNVATAGNEAGGGADIRVRRGSNTVVRLPGLIGSTSTDADNLITANNPLATTVTVSGTTFSGGGPCATPALPSGMYKIESNQPDNYARLGNGSQSDRQVNRTVATLKNTQPATARSMNASASNEVLAVLAERSAEILGRTMRASFDETLDVRKAALGQGGSGLQYMRANSTAPLGQPREQSSEKRETRRTPQAARNAASLAAPAAVRAPAAAVAFAGGNVSVNGAGTGFTLPAGKTVTIIFTVTVNNPPNLTTPVVGVPQVSTQGTVAGTTVPGGSFSILTDDTDVAGANNPTVSTIDLFGTNTAISSSSPGNTSNQNDPVTFTATVTPNNAPAAPPGGTVPTGAVDFFDGVNPIASCSGVSVNGAGVATCTISTLSPGSHTIKAQYTGDGNFDPSSNTLTQTVNPCTSATVVLNTADSGAGSLRQAIIDTCPGGTITFAPALLDQQITLTTAELNVDKNLTITGLGANHLTVQRTPVTASIPVPPNFRIFNIQSGKTVGISGLTITNGSSVTNGGGIANAGNLTLTACAVTFNSAVTDGGGIFNTGTLAIKDSTISNNVATTNGGGISNSGPLTVKNSTISTNTANGGGGGGIHNNVAAASLVNCTVAANTAVNATTGLGGGIFNIGTTNFTIGNTVVGDNTAGNSNPDLSGTFVSQDNNRFEDATGATFVDSVGTPIGGLPANATTGDAKLGPLFNNGGPTQTHAPLPDSPLLDAGSDATATAATLITDQRGTNFPRFADSADVGAVQTVDIGAYEANPSLQDIGDQTTDEDSATPLTVTFRVGDEALGVPTITTLSSNTGLVPNASIVLEPVTTTGERTLTITPAANQFGTTTVTVTLTAANGGTMSDQFLLTVREVNDAPTAVDDTLPNIAEDSGQQIIPFSALTANDSTGPLNESGQTLTVASVGNAVGGTVLISGSNVLFTPTANYNGPASFQYTVQDNGTTAGSPDFKTSGLATVSFGVTEVNNAPTAVGDTLTNVAEDSGQRTIPFSDLTANDNKGAANESGQTLTVVSVSNPIGGTVSISGSNVLFTPTADYNGPASFQYTVQDDGTTAGSPDFKTSGLATVSFSVTEVNDAPVGTDDALSAVLEDSGARTISFASLLTNDTKGAANESTQTLVITNVSNAVGGTVNISGTDVIFTPTANFNGAASFTYTLQDNGKTNGVDDFKTATANVTFNITAVNDAPTLDALSDKTVAEDAPAQSINLSGITAGAGESGQVLTVTASSSDTAIIPTPTVTYTSDQNTGSISFAPAANANGGPVTITVTVTDDGGVLNGGLNTISRTFIVNITEVNDAPVGTDDALSAVLEDSGARTISFASLLTNDTKGAANESTQTLVITNVSNAVGGTVNISGTDVIFTPTANFNGAASFTYTLQDNGKTNGVDDFKTATANVTFNITAVNDAPTATAQSVTTDEDVAKAITLAGVDVDNDTLTFSIVAQPTHGTLTGTGATRTYTPNGNFNGSDSFTFKVNDGTIDSATATVSITINAVNDAPTNIVPGTQTTSENSAVVFNAAHTNLISIADVDAGTDPLQVTLVAANGTLTLGSTAGLSFSAGDGTADATMTFTGTITNINLALNGLSFAPTSGFSGAAASVKITTDDLGHNGTGGALSDTDTVNITVNNGGDLQLSAATLNVNENAGTTTITVKRTGGSAGATTVAYATSAGTATAATSCASGVDYVTTSGTLSWTDGETADKTFTVTICDDSAFENSETVNLTLSNVTGSGSLGSIATSVLTINDDDASGGTFKFSQPTYNVDEGGSVTITVERTGTTTLATTVNYATSDSSASSVSDYTTALGTLRFAAGEGSKTFTLLTTEDSRIEGTEALTITLSNPTNGAVIIQPSSATVEITDDVPESTGNPNDDAEQFVIQHYHDFLNREPDAAGLAFWTAQITECESRPEAERQPCREARRINVSAAFFLSIEFQKTGCLVYRVHDASFDTGEHLELNDFLADTQEISRGVIIGQPGAEALLEQHKVAYFDAFVEQQSFLNRYAVTMSPADFVNALNLNTGGALTQAEVDTVVQELTTGGNTTHARAVALRRVAENAEFARREFNKAFVLMQYFGYLRRNPNALPDTDFSGYNFWLNKLNQFNGNFVQAEMVKAFITSGEYRLRFAQP